MVFLSVGWSGGAGLAGLTGARRGSRRSGPLGRLTECDAGTTVLPVWQSGFVWVTARLGWFGFSGVTRRSLTSESEKEKRGRRCPCGSPVAGDRETIAGSHFESSHRLLVETPGLIVCFRYDVIGLDQLFNLRV